jgi:hypothetical protein
MRHHLMVLLHGLLPIILTTAMFPILAVVLAAAGNEHVLEVTLATVLGTVVGTLVWTVRHLVTTVDRMSATMPTANAKLEELAGDVREVIRKIDSWRKSAERTTSEVAKQVIQRRTARKKRQEPKPPETGP